MPRHSRPMARHNAQESSDRAALLSPPDLAPTSADGVFVPNNGVITLNLNRPPAEKKTEGLQYQKGRDSCFVSAKSRVSKKSRDSCLVSRENPKGPVAGADGARTAARGGPCRPCRAIAAPCRPMPRHNAQEAATGRLFSPHPTWPRRARMGFSFPTTASSLST